MIGVDATERANVWQQASALPHLEVSISNKRHANGGIAKYAVSA